MQYIDHVTLNQILYIFLSGNFFRELSIFENLGNMIEYNKFTVKCTFFAKVLLKQAK